MGGRSGLRCGSTVVAEFGRGTPMADENLRMNADGDAASEPIIGLKGAIFWVRGGPERVRRFC